MNSTFPTLVGTAVFFGVTLAGRLLAESPYEAQAKQLQDRRDAEVRAAVDPINKRYRAELEKLLKKATQANDLDAALKIRERLKEIPDARAAKPKNEGELAAWLDGTVWEISDGEPGGPVVYTLTFSKNGTFKHSDGRTGKVSFTGARTMMLWGYDPAAFDEEFKGFKAKGTHAVYYGRPKT